MSDWKAYSANKQAQKKAAEAKGTETIDKVIELKETPKENIVDESPIINRFNWSSNKEFSHPIKRTEEFKLPDFLHMKHGDAFTGTQYKNVKEHFDPKAKFLQSYYRIGNPLLKEGEEGYDVSNPKKTRELTSEEIYNTIYDFPKSQHMRFWNPGHVKAESDSKTDYDLDRVNNELIKEYEIYKSSPKEYEAKRAEEFGDFKVGRGFYKKPEGEKNFAFDKVNPDKVDEGIKRHAKEMSEKDIGTIMEANKAASEYANTDVLKSKGIEASKFTVGETGGIDYFDESLIGKDFDEVKNAFVGTFEDLGIKVPDFSFNPKTGKVSIGIRHSED